MRTSYHAISAIATIYFISLTRGNAAVYYSSMTHAEQTERRRKIKQQFLQGHSVARIAARFKLSKNTVLVAVRDLPKQKAAQ